LFSIYRQTIKKYLRDVRRMVAGVMGRREMLADTTQGRNTRSDSGRNARSGHEEGTRCWRRKVGEGEMAAEGRGGGSDAGGGRLADTWAKGWG
jgi:hypothetical protein